MPRYRVYETNRINLSISVVADSEEEAFDLAVSIDREEWREDNYESISTDIEEEK